MMKTRMAQYKHEAMHQLNPDLPPSNDNNNEEHPQGWRSSTTSPNKSRAAALLYQSPTGASRQTIFTKNATILSQGGRDYLEELSL